MVSLKDFIIFKTASQSAILNYTSISGALQIKSIYAGLLLKPTLEIVYMGSKN